MEGIMSRIDLLKVIMSLFILLSFFGYGYCQEDKTEIVIENNSFGVIRDKSQELILFVLNTDCIANYKVVHKEIVLGEGTIDLSSLTKSINLGDTRIKFLCVAGKELNVSIK